MHDIDYWIGLNDLSVESKKQKKGKIVMKCLFPEDYVWSESHEAAEYTNWREHEPDNRRGQVTALKYLHSSFNVT